MALPQVGSQLIVFGKKYDIENDIEAILDSLQKAGYAAVEGGPRDAARYRPMLDKRGLVYAGSHMAISGKPDIEQLVEYSRIMGSSDVSNSGLVKWGDVTLDDYRQSIRLLNEAGRKLRDAGIHLHYHNHAFEFDKVDGSKSGMDILLDGLDADAVDFCIDVAWVQKGGENIVEYLQKHKDRIGYLHFKDYDDEGWCELGRGQIDFAPIMQLLPDMPRVRWVVCEQDETRNEPMESVAVSRRYLRDTFGY
jgi:sugar phosphate isomerase/epimerase